MTTKEVANKLVAHCRQGQFESATTELYGSNIVSIEPAGSPMEKIEGIEGVIAKGKHFSDMVQEFHSLEVSDPIIADQFFSCSMKMDVTYKEGGRNTMEEVCLYHVTDGKIDREEFFYTIPTSEG
jgi:hypothetical protein